MGQILKPVCICVSSLSRSHFASKNSHFRPIGPENPCKYISLYVPQIAEVLVSKTKLGSRNTTMTSDFRPEVEISCFMHVQWKTMLYNPYSCTNRQNFHVLLEIRLKEVNGDVRFQIGSRNMVTSLMRSEKYALLWIWLWGRYRIPQKVYLVY